MKGQKQTRNMHNSVWVWPPFAFC